MLNELIFPDFLQAVSTIKPRRHSNHLIIGSCGYYYHDHSIINVSLTQCTTYMTDPTLASAERQGCNPLLFPVVLLSSYLNILKDGNEVQWQHKLTTLSETRASQTLLYIQIPEYY